MSRHRGDCPASIVPTGVTRIPRDQLEAAERRLHEPAMSSTSQASGWVCGPGELWLLAEPGDQVDHRRDDDDAEEVGEQGVP